MNLDSAKLERLVQSVARIEAPLARIDGRRADAYDPDQPRDETGKFASGGFAGSLKQTGGKLGSNPGGQYVDGKGQKYYVKEAKSAAHAANEVLAGHLYAAAGSPITQAHRLGDEKGSRTISKWATHEKAFDPHDPNHIAEARKHFGTHAWLANWDAVGLENDNQVKIAGKLHTVDAGGAMKYRAQGGEKNTWGPSVHEFETMRDAKYGPQAAHVFGGMTHEELRNAATRVAEVPDETIRELVMKHGHGSDDQKAMDAEILVARKRDLWKRTKAHTASETKHDSAEFDEGKHPRAADGKFGSGSGSTKPTLTPREKAWAKLVKAGLATENPEQKSPVSHAERWAKEGDAKGLTSVFEPEDKTTPRDPKKMSDDQWDALPTVYHGSVKGTSPNGFTFVTKSKSGAEFHSQNGGTLRAFKVLPGSKLYADLEGGDKLNGYQSLIDPPKNSYGGSSGIVHLEDLAPIDVRSK